MPEQINCPVCESSIPADSEKCPECGVDLSLFDVDTSEASINSEEDIERIMGKLMEEDDEMEIVDELQEINGEETEVVEEEEEHEGEEEEHEGEEEEYEEELMFECPICEAEVSEDAMECPNCGAIFEEEGEEEVTEEELEEFEEELSEDEVGEVTEEVTEEIPEEMLDEEKEKELTEGIQKVKDMMGKVRGAKIDNTAFKEGLNRLLEAAKEEDYDRGLDILNDLKDMGSKILEADDYLTEIQDMMEEIPENIDISEQQEKLDEIMSLGEVGDYSAALVKADEVLEDLEEIKTSEVEEVKEEMKRKFKEARNILADARNTKLKIGNLKDLMGEAVEAKNSEDYNEAIEKLDEVILSGQYVVTLYEDLLEGKRKIKELKEEKLDYKPHLKELKKAKKEADKGNYESSEEILAETFSNIRTALETEEEIVEEEVIEVEEEEVPVEEPEEITEEELKSEFRERLTSLKDKVSEARETGIDISPMKDLVKEVKETGTAGDFESALEIMDEIDETFANIIEVNEDMLVAWERIEDLKDREMEYQGYEFALDEAKELADDGEYETAKEKIRSVSDEITERIEEVEREEQERIQELRDEFNEKLEKAKEKLSEARDFKINIDELKRYLREATEAEKEDDFELGYEKIDKILDGYENLKQVSEKIEEGKNRIKQLKEEGVDFKGYIKQLKLAKMKADEGDYEKSVEMIQDSIEEMDEELEELELEEGLPSPEEIEAEIEKELKKTEGTVEVEEAVEEEIIEPEEELVTEEEVELEEEAVETELEEEVEEVPEAEVEEIAEEEEITEEEKVSLDDIEDMVSDIRSIMTAARDFGFTIEKGKDIIDEAVESTESQDYEHAFDLLEEGREEVTEEIEDKMEEEMMDIELNLEGMEDSENLDEIKDGLADTREALSSGEYIQALDILNETEEKITPVKGPQEEVEEKISNVEGIIFNADTLGIDTFESSNLIDRAKEEVQVGNYMEAEDYVKEAREKVLTDVPEILKQKVSKAQKDLMKAKIVGVDVSEPVDLLKQANLARKNEDYEKCILYMKKYNDVMEERMD